MIILQAQAYNCLSDSISKSFNNAIARFLAVATAAVKILSNGDDDDVHDDGNNDKFEDNDDGDDDDDNNFEDDENDNDDFDDDDDDDNDDGDNDNYDDDCRGGHLLFVKFHLKKDTITKGLLHVWEKKKQCISYESLQRG